MPIEESLSIILAEMLAIRTRTPPPSASVSLTDRMTTLDIFEMMIRIDDLAVASSLSGTSPTLEHWVEVDCPSLLRRLENEPRGYMLAVVLVLSPRGLARVARHLSFFRWMEIARAANNLSPDQLKAIRGNHALEAYLTGASSVRPALDLPMLFPLPMPSVLRVVQSARFRFNLLQAEGHEEALRRYVRFFC
jgi:hypothetical protein